MFESAQTPSTWTFGGRQLVYGAIGAVLYGVFSWMTNMLVGTITFRPAVAVLIFFGAAYGPWVGLLAGLCGDLLGNALSGYGMLLHWSVGSALIGMIPGLMMTKINDFRALHDILRVVGWGIFGLAIGMLFASLTEMLVSGIDLRTALDYFRLAFLGNFAVTVILLPILMIAFARAVKRRHHE